RRGRARIERISAGPGMVLLRESRRDRRRHAAERVHEGARPGQGSEGAGGQVPRAAGRRGDRGGDGVRARGTASELDAVARAPGRLQHLVQGHAQEHAVGAGRGLRGGTPPTGIMRFDYGKWQGPRPDDIRFVKQIMEIYRSLLLQTGGDVEEALKWMEQFGEQYGFFNDTFGIEAFKKLLEKSGEAERTRAGFQITPKGEKRIRQDSLNEIFSTLQAGGPGDHRTPVAGKGGERLSETRAYQFGDNLSDLDPLTTMGNVLKNHGIDDLQVTEEDLAVYENEHLSACATVLMVDVSHSMILYGEDRITPAKKIALALTQLIQTRY